MSIIVLALCSNLSMAGENSVDVEWFSDMEASFGRNDNIGQAAFERDIAADNFALVNYTLLSNIEIGDSKAVTLKAILEHQQVNRVEDLSRSTVGFEFAYRWQNTLGYLAPFYQFNTSIEFNKYGVKQRDSTVSNTQLFVTKRLSDQFTMVAGLAHYIEDSEGTVFDLKHDRAFLSLDYAPNQRQTYYASYSYRKGEIWSTAQVAFCDGTPADDIFPLISAAKAAEPDEAFNNAFCGNWLAYQLDADTHTFTVGANIAVSGKSAVDVSAVWVDSEATGTIDYQSTIIRASYLVRF